MVSSGDDSENIKKAVEELGYKYVSSPNTRDATGKMRYHHFDLIILDDGFDGQELERSPVLNFLNHLSMSQRRRIFVAAFRVSRVTLFLHLGQLTLTVWSLGIFSSGIFNFV